MNTRIDLRMGRADVWRKLQAIARALNNDTSGLMRRLKLRVGTALLSQVQQDFVRKSHGETGKDGIKWKELKPATIARRRVTKDERKQAGVDERNYTKIQQLVYKSAYATNFAKLRLDMPEAAAMVFARQLAKLEVKRAGKKSQVELFGGRKVDILRDTGELLRSFSPGVAAGREADVNFVGPSEHPDGQIFRIDPDAVTVGSNKKPWHHQGVPGRLPSRPFWPLNGLIPEAWWPAINQACLRGITEAFNEVAAKGVR